MNLWRKFLKWNADADENSIAYNLLHLIFWAIVFGVGAWLII